MLSVEDIIDDVSEDLVGFFDDENMLLVFEVGRILICALGSDLRLNVCSVLISVLSFLTIP